MLRKFRRKIPAASLRVSWLGLVRFSLTADLQSSKYVRFVLWVQRLLQESKYANQLGSGDVGNRSCRQVAPAASIVNILTAALCFFFTTFFTNSARAEVLKVIALATFFAGTVRLFLVTVPTSPTSTCTHHVCTLSQILSIVSLNR